MPLYYPDWSNNNWSSTAQAVAACADVINNEGYSAIVHKVSEGSYYADPYWPPVRDWCNANNVPVLGYHYVTTDNSDEQAQKFVANGGGSFAMLDFESNSGNIANFWAVVNAFNRAGVEIQLSYIPHWYWQQIGSPDISQVPGLVSSSYLERGTYASTEYLDSGGDSGPGWNSYGGATPVAWQFTDGATMAGISSDANAFKGSLDDLRALFGSAHTPPPPPPPIGPPPVADAQSIANANNGVDAQGNQLPWRLVHLLRNAQIGDLATGEDPESDNVSSSEYDQIVTLAKILTRRYKGHDVFDMLALIGDKLGAL